MWFLFKKLLKPRKLLNVKQSDTKSLSKDKIYSDIEQTITETQRTLGNSADLVVYKFQTLDKTFCALLYLQSFVNFEQLGQFVLSPLISLKTLPIQPKDLTSFLPYPNVGEISSLEQIFLSIVNGEVVLLISGFESGLKIPLKKYEQRTITEPKLLLNSLSPISSSQL